MRTKNPELMNEISAYVDSYYRANHFSPSLSEIAKGVNVAKTTVYRYLVEMNERGLISYDGHTIESTKIDKCATGYFSAPIVGSIRCGDPEAEEEHVEEYVSLPESIFGKGTFYILRATGDSMIDAGIDNGDMVVVSKQNTAKVGDIVVALVDNETTLKTYMVNEAGRMLLRPQNKSMADIYPDNCFIQGVVKFIIKAV